MSQRNFDDDTTFDVETVSSKSTCTSAFSATSVLDFVEVKAHHCRVTYKDRSKRELICVGTDKCQKRGHANKRATGGRAPVGYYQGWFSKRNHDLLVPGRGPGRAPPNTRPTSVPSATAIARRPSESQGSWG